MIDLIICYPSFKAIYLNEYIGVCSGKPLVSRNDLDLVRYCTVPIFNFGRIQVPFDLTVVLVRGKPAIHSK